MLKKSSCLDVLSRSAGCVSLSRGRGRTLRQRIKPEENQNIWTSPHLQLFILFWKSPIGYLFAFLTFLCKPCIWCITWMRHFHLISSISGINTWESTSFGTNLRILFHILHFRCLHLITSITNKKMPHGTNKNTFSERRNVECFCTWV